MDSIQQKMCWVFRGGDSTYSYKYHLKSAFHYTKEISVEFEKKRSKVKIVIQLFFFQIFLMFVFLIATIGAIPLANIQSMVSKTDEYEEAVKNDPLWASTYKSYIFWRR